MTFFLFFLVEYFNLGYELLAFCTACKSGGSVRQVIDVSVVSLSCCVSDNIGLLFPYSLFGCVCVCKRYHFGFCV